MAGGGLLSRCRHKQAHFEMPRGVLWLLVFGLAGADGFGATLGMTASTSIGAPMKIIVCQGSSCMGKCRGMFNPKDSFTEAMSAGEAGKGGEEIEIEEVQCMNMCKRGPNVRMVLRGELMTVDDKMNETEEKRKAFQVSAGRTGA